MKKILFISIIAILLANSIMAGGSKEEATLDQLGRIKEKGEITIAMEGTWAPWTYHNEKDELVGYDTEVGKAIAEKLGVKPVFIEGEWDGLLAGLDAGRYDIMINGVDYTEERGKKYDFSTPYAYNRTAVITSEDNTAISSMEDLKGKKTANTISSTYAEVAEKYGFGRIVSDADFRFVPYAFMTLRPVELHDSILTLKEVGGSRMVAIRGSGLDAVQGNVLYIWALDEDGVSVTNELRHLHLNAGTVRMMIALGYEWLMFQTGDSVVMIHLTELENGSYIITVDPQNADCTVSVSLDGEERNQLPDAMLVAEITDVPATV